TRPSNHRLRSPLRCTAYFVRKNRQHHPILPCKQDQCYPLPIPNHLLRMLKRVPFPTQAPRPWGGSLLNRPANHPEKGDQIMLMHKIYTLTRRVLIYLGEPDETTTSATNLMDHIYRAVRNTPADLELRPMRWQMHNHLPLVNEWWSWEPLKDFFCRP